MEAMNSSILCIEHNYVIASTFLSKNNFFQKSMEQIRKCENEAFVCRVLNTKQNEKQFYNQTNLKHVTGCFAIS